MSEIDELRDDIARIDAEMVALVGRRLDIAKLIGDYKRQNGLAIVVPDVENAVRKRYIDEARKVGVPEDMAEKLAELLIACGRSVQ